MKNTYFGFTDKLSILEKGKVERTLDIRIKHNNTYISNKEFVYKQLQQGFIPEIQANYTQPKTLYKLTNNDSYHKINKTLYNFAKYILTNDFLNEVKAIRHITEEQQRASITERISNQ